MKFNTKTVTISGEKYKIKEMDARQRQKFLKIFRENSDAEEAQAVMIQMCCPTFKDMSIDEIFSIPGRVFAEISDIASDLSGLSGDSEEEAEKNS